MSDGLTSPDRPAGTPTPETPGARAGRSLGAQVAAQVAVVVVSFVVVGVLLGFAWYHLWDQPSGVVSDKQWYTDETGLRDTFQGTGWYVALAAGAGLVLGVLFSWLLERSELATLGAVLVGSVLAGLAMYLVGTHLSPPDPHVLARTAKDGVRLKGQLSVDGWSPKAAFPFGALLGLVLVYFLTSRRAPEEPVRADVQTTPPGGSQSGFGPGTSG